MGKIIWTEERVATLKTLVRRDYPYSLIAERFGGTVTAVRSKIKSLRAKGEL